MKKMRIIFMIVLFTLFCTAAMADVEINETNFPDEKFKEFIHEKIDADEDGILSNEELENTTFIDCQDRGITNLKGIEHFRKLRGLFCSGCALTSLNLSQNKELTDLHCINCSLSNLDLSNNPNLGLLWCRGNKINNLDLSKNTQLENLDCSQNELTVLDVSNLVRMKIFRCYDNKLKSLNVSRMSELEYLSCNGNDLDELNVNNNKKLVLFECTKNNLTSIDISNNTALRFFDCGGNKLTTLDTSKNKLLNVLDCFGNKITSLNLKENKELLCLQIRMNKVLEVDVSLNNKLVQVIKNGNLFIGDSYKSYSSDDYIHYEGREFRGRIEFDKKTQIIAGDTVIIPELDDGIAINNTNFPDLIFRQYVEERIDTNYDGVLSDKEINSIEMLNIYEKNIESLKGIEYFTKLTYLDCRTNQISVLDISKNSLLKTLVCADNRISELNVSKNVALEVLGCYNNQINNLDISKNKALTELNCHHNQLSSLNITKNTELRLIDICHNKIQILDISACSQLCELVKNNQRFHNDEFQIDGWRDNIQGTFIQCDSFTKVIAGSFISEPTVAGFPEETIEPVIGELFDANGFKYKVTAKNTVTFIGLIKTKSKSTVVIPTVVTYKDVTFKVTEIGSKAFKNDTKIAVLTIGKNIKTIGKNAFANCTKLKTVKGGVAVTVIKDGAFSGCKVLKTFPAMNKLQKIGNNAFKGDKALAKFTLAKTVTNIGKNSFNGCAGLKTITVKTEKLTNKNVGAGAFKGINKKATFKCPKKQLKNYKKLFVKKGAPKSCKFK